VLVVSDEHVTFQPVAPVRVGDHVRVWPAHVDPTVGSPVGLHGTTKSKVVSRIRWRWP